MFSGDKLCGGYWLLICALFVAGGSQDDWWTLLQSEPSMGSTTQLHTPSIKGPEFAQAMLEMEGPYIHVNKGTLKSRLKQKKYFVSNCV